MRSAFPFVTRYIIALLSIGFFANALMEPSCSAADYTLVDLGALAGNQSYGAAINKTGQVTGWSTVDRLSDQHAFLYSAGSNPQMTDIGSLGCWPLTATSPCEDNLLSSAGLAINDSGAVTGWSQIPADLTPAVEQQGGWPILHAFVFLPEQSNAATGVMTDITLSSPTCPDGSPTSGDLAGVGINSTGEVTGPALVSCPAGTANQTFLYSPGPSTSQQYLPTPWGSSDAILFPFGGLFGPEFFGGINTASWVVGSMPAQASQNAATASHAFLYAATQSPVLTDLGTLGGTDSLGVAVSDAGQVLGVSSLTGDQSSQSFLYAANNPSAGLTPVASPTPTAANFGYGINDSGWVVGQYAANMNVSASGFLYAPKFGPSPEASVDLNALINQFVSPSCYVTLTKGDAINDSGWIVADGANSCSGTKHAYILKPVPPPRYICGEQSVGDRSVFVVCPILPPFVAQCNVQCALNFTTPVICPACIQAVQITWRLPNLPAYPQLGGSSLVALALDPGRARTLAGELTVSLTTQQLAGPPAERMVELQRSGSAGVSRGAIVGPVVEVVGSAQALQALPKPTAGHDAGAARLTLPIAKSSNNRKVEMALFDAETGRWNAIESRSSDSGSNLVNAAISLPGKYTLVAISP